MIRTRPVGDSKTAASSWRNRTPNASANRATYAGWSPAYSLFPNTAHTGADMRARIVRTTVPNASMSFRSVVSPASRNRSTGPRRSRSAVTAGRCSFPWTSPTAAIRTDAPNVGRVDEQVALRLGCDRRLAAVDRGEVPHAEHRLHHVEWTRVAHARNRRHQVVHAPAVVREDADAFDAQEGGVPREDHVRIEEVLDRGRERRLGLGRPNGVMVPREHDDGDAVREVRDHPCERLVLTVDVIDCEFLVLTRVDADAVHDVSAHDEVADRPGDLVGAPEPCGHFRPLVLEECAAPDVNVGHERRADVVTGSSERLDGRQVRPNDRLGDHEPSVVDGPDDSDDFIQDGDLRGDGRLRRKEDRDPVRLVLDFQDPVAVLRRAHVRDDADDPHLARRSAGLRDLLGPREVVAGPPPCAPGLATGAGRTR